MLALYALLLLIGSAACSGTQDRTVIGDKASQGESASAITTSTTSESTRASDAPWRTERSSAGDTVVFRTIGANHPAALLTLVREQVIGKRNGAPEENFQDIENVVPMPDGGVLFFEYGAYVVRRFDSTGKYILSYGRSGNGPGEWTSVSRILLTPDNGILVAGGGRFHLFESGGTLSKGWAMRFPNSRFGGAGSLRALTADGKLHVSTYLDDPFYPDSFTAPGYRANRDAVHRIPLDSAANMRADGQMADTVYQPRARAQLPRFIYQNRGSPTRSPIPFVPLIRSVYSTQGYWITGNDDASYAFVLHTKPRLIRIESDLAHLAIPDDERSGHLYRWMYDLRRFDPAARPTLDLIPKTKPPIKTLTTDSEGRIWVLISQPATKVAIDTMPDPNAPGASGKAAGGGVAGARGTTAPTGPTTPAMNKPTSAWIEKIAYDVFTPGGDFLGRVELPPNSTFGNSKGDRIWIVLKDELDVPTVVRYRVTPLANESAPRWK